MIGSFSNSMYDCINNGKVGWSFSRSCMLHRPKDASMSSCVCPTIMKDKITSFTIRLATNKDQKQKTYLFLFSFQELSIWMWSTGGSGRASSGSKGTSPKELVQISLPSSNARYNSVLPAPAKSAREDLAGGGLPSLVTILQWTPL